jgi:hypothetical protein
MRPRTLSYPPDPAYGTGLCRRRITIRAGDGCVQGHLADNFHEMRCRIRHDGFKVTGVEGETIRIPTTACPSAAAVLQELVGLRLDTPVQDFYRDGRARHHCTHLFDLAVLAIRQGRHRDRQLSYDAIVPDETEAPVEVSIRRDGQLVHCWLVSDGTILEPPHLRGRTLERGFARWAAETYQGDDLDAATILARTWLIAIGRRFLTTSAAGQTIAQNVEMIGRCFAYTRSVAEMAKFRSDNVVPWDAI